MFRSRKVNRREAGKLPTTAVTNELADAVNFNNPSFLVGAETPDMAFTFSFDAIIWDAGPNGEPDGTTNGYWLKPQAVLGAASTNTASIRDSSSLLPTPIAFGTNLGERLVNAPSGYGTHFLQKYDRVRVFLDVDDGDPPKARYVFHRPVDFIQAKITGASVAGGKWLHTWQEQREGTAGGVTGGGGGDQFHAATCSSGGRVRDNLIVVLRVGRFFADTSPTFEIIDVPDPQGIFPVDVTQVSGSGGNQTNYPSWTYDVKWNGVTIGSGLQPECGRARITQWTVTAGSKGSAYWGTAGAVVLFDVNEKGDNNACT